MDTIAKPRASTLVNIRCEECGDIDRITDRQYRRKLYEGRPHVCRICRVTTVRKPTTADYDYWLDRYSLDEIKDIAQAIWG